MIYSFQRSTSKGIYAGREADRAAIDNIIRQHGLYVNEIVDGLRLTQYKIKLNPESNITALTRKASAFKIALNCEDIDISQHGDTLTITRPGADNLLRLGNMYNKQFIAAQGLKLMIGQDIDGHNIYTDLAKQPHVLVAGTTGSGKSMLLHQFIISLLTKHNDITIYGIDAKGTEFKVYEKARQFFYISETPQAIQVLNDLVSEMDRRYQFLADNSCRDIDEAKARGCNIGQIVVIIDELADLIIKNKQVEAPIIRLAQKARAAGIHLIIGTQRPTREVVTGLIKANIPSRICLKVTSGQESRLILDAKGGEKLTGRGDLLYKANGQFEAIRCQSCYIEPSEMQSVAMANNTHTNAPKATQNTTMNTFKQETVEAFAEAMREIKTVFTGLFHRR